MKSHEFVNEGFADWAKNKTLATGILGRNKKLIAQNRLSQDADYKFGLDNFITSLNRIMSSKRGATNLEVERVVTEFVTSQVKNYTVSKEDENSIEQDIIPTVVSNFINEKYTVGSTTRESIKQLWDLIWRVGSSQARSRDGKLAGAGSAGASNLGIKVYDYPEETTFMTRTTHPGDRFPVLTSTVNSTNYAYDFLENRWNLQKVTPASRSGPASTTFVPVTNDTLITALNKAYHAKYGV